MTPTPTEVKIHEFSTGIRPERTADGGWVSLGFTGQYMNATIDPIPYTIQRSIANKEFAVAEGASSSEPAFIGRVVSGGEESKWSVVAIVTRGRDEKGRSTSVYRYFLSEGADSLCKILAWIEYQHQNGRIPVFDPFETKVVGQPNISMVPDPSFKPLSPESESWLFSDSIPVIIQPGQPYTAQSINKLATEKAKTNGQPVTWAFKVEALEQPGRFQVIQAASNRAYELLQRAKVSTSQVTAPIVDEQAMKSAIKGLISSSRVKPEYVQAIADFLGDTSIPEGYWKEIFDGQGAANALKQGIYSPQMVRLLTLRAIVIPVTLSDYLAWLEKGNKQNDPYTVSTDFQYQLRNSLSKITATAPNIEANITKGLQLLLSQLVELKISPEAVHRLLTLPKGLWARFSRQAIQDIEHDLNLMRRFALGHRDLPFKLTDYTWQSVRRDLQIYWRQPSYPPQTKYQSLAQLFGQLDYPKISAFFYHVGYGKVPKEIFFQIRPAGWDCTVYGVRVKRELSISDIPELFWLTIIEVGSKIVPVQVVSVLVIIFLALGFAIGKIFGHTELTSARLEQQHFQNEVENPGTELITNDSLNWNPIITKIEVDALNKFSETIESINRIVEELQFPKTQEQSIPREKIIEQMQKALVDLTPIDEKDLNFLKLKTDAEELKLEEKLKLMNVIYTYQVINKLFPINGYLSKENKGETFLKNDIKKRLKLT